ncbi:MAG: hypothetical protein LKJ90_06550 [Faecalibacterium sp.]|nr:hypothetical protein [Faecalibacterium sp.]
MILSAADYLGRILHYYAGSFDVQAPCTWNGRPYAALAAMHAHEDQFVHLVGTTLWEADSHEFTLFETYENAPPTAEQVARSAGVIRDEMEPQFVRGGNPLPPSEHQYTWLTVVLIAQKAPDEAAIRAVQHVKQTKFYRFYLRGYSEARMVLVDLENRRLYTNAAGKTLKKVYQAAFDFFAKAEKRQAP